MIRLIFLVFWVLMIQDVRAQVIDFFSIDSIPEYDLFRPTYIKESTTWVLTSLVNDYEIVITDSVGDTQQVIEFEKKIPRTFTYFNADSILAYNGNDYFMINNHSIFAIGQNLTESEPPIALMPSIEGMIFIPTINGLYRSDDRFITYEKMISWDSRNPQIIQSCVYNNSIFFIIILDNRYYLKQIDKDGIEQLSWDLNFEPSNFYIIDDVIFFADRSKNLYKSNLSDGIISSQSYQNMGSTVILRSFENNLLANDFNNSTIYYFNNNSLVDYSVEELNNRLFPSFVSKSLYFSLGTNIFVPTSLNPLQFDTIVPNATATKINDLKTYNDNMYVQTDNAFYALENDEWVQRQQGGLRFEVDHAGNVLVDGPDTGLDEIWYSTDNALSFNKLPIDYIIATKMINFEDTTLVSGNQNCDEFNNSTISGMTTDGSISWQSDIVEAPRCFEQRFTTVTKDRVYIYDHDEDYALGLGNAIYSWFAYYDRNEKQFKYEGGDRDIMPFIPTSSNQLSSNNVCFYVSPDEIFYANPLRDNISGYHSLDRGETWIETVDSPTGRIYPTTDSTGTIVIQNDPDGKRGTKFYVRYDVTQPYVELDINIDLPPIEYLKYTSDGRMIVASETGYFYISDGITSTIDDVREAQTALTVYPNPTTDILYIRSQHSISQVEVMDFNGRSVYATKTTDPIDMSAWYTGVYLVSVILDDGQRVTRKVIKM